MKELDFELLKTLYCIHSKSKNEKIMRDFLSAWIVDNVPNAIITKDKMGNLYITKGEAETYPCLCAHMDQVQHLHPKDFTCIDSDDVIFGYSPSLRKQCGLGGDDKNGLFIALSCLKKYSIIKCAFFVSEEIGCIGSTNADMDFFKDCRFCVQIDRRGNSDMVTRITDYIASFDFIDAISCERYGYQESDGMLTDVEALTENGVGISCINLSCGYYAPHSDEEFSVKSDIEKCYKFVCHIIEDCTDVYPFVANNYSFNQFEDEENFAYLCDDYITNYQGVTFNNIYEIHREDFPKLSKKEMRKIFMMEKSYYDFGS